jgi:hypothetical protein
MHRAECLEKAGKGKLNGMIGTGPAAQNYPPAQDMYLEGPYPSSRSLADRAHHGLLQIHSRPNGRLGCCRHRMSSVCQGVVLLMGLLRPGLSICY